MGKSSTHYKTNLLKVLFLYLGFINQNLNSFRMRDAILKSTERLLMRPYLNKLYEFYELSILKYL